VPDLSRPGAILRSSPGPFWWALLVTAAFRLIYSAVAAAFTPTLHLSAEDIGRNDFTDQLMQPADGLRYALLGVWERFDTLWYTHIALNGYDRPEATVFFPLYPLLIRLASAVTGNPLAAAVSLTTLATFLLFWGFLRLSDLDRPAEEGRRAILAYAVWPASFVFFAAYPESLAAALTVWSVYWARRGRWPAAGGLALLASLTKATGFAVLLPLAVLARRAGRRAWIVVGALVAGPAVGWLTLRVSGLPTPEETYRHHWVTQFTWPWETLYRALSELAQGGPLILFYNLALLSLTCMLAISRKPRMEYVYFSAGVAAMVLVKNTDPVLQSTARYMLAVFPAFLTLGTAMKNFWVFAVAGACAFAVNIALLAAYLDWQLVV